MIYWNDLAILLWLNESWVQKRHRLITLDGNRKNVSAYGNVLPPKASSCQAKGLIDGMIWMECGLNNIMIWNTCFFFFLEIQLSKRPETAAGIERYPTLGRLQMHSQIRMNDVYCVDIDQDNDKF